MNPPAFPYQFVANEDSEENRGLSLRDYFAAKAMQGIVTNSSFHDATFITAQKQGRSVGELIAAVSFEYADAMLSERLKGENKQ